MVKPTNTQEKADWIKCWLKMQFLMVFCSGKSPECEKQKAGAKMPKWLGNNIINSILK